MKKKLLIPIFLLTLLFVLIPSATVLAEGEEVTRLSDQYPDNRYDLMTYADDKWYQWAAKTGTAAISSIKNFLWNINVIIANITLMVIYQLFSLDIVELTKDSIMAIASGTAGSLVTNLGGFALAVASLGIVIRAYIKQDWQAFFKIVTLIILSFALLFSIQSKAFNYVGFAHTISVSLENAVMKINPSLTDSQNFDLNRNGNNLGDQVSVEVENKAFESLLFKPYLLLQYGTTDEEAINAEQSYNGEFSRIKEYLEANPSTEDGQDLREDIAEYELEELNNESIFAGNGFLAGGYTMGIILSTIIQAVVFFFLALVRIMLQFGFVMMLIMLPFMLFASIFPTFETLVGKYAKSLGLLILFKGVVVFFVLVATSFITLSYEMADLSDDIYYRIFIQIIFSLSIIFLYAKRSFITNMFNGADIDIEGLASGGSGRIPGARGLKNKIGRGLTPGKRSPLGRVGKSSGKLAKNGMKKVAGVTTSASRKGWSVSKAARSKFGSQMTKAKDYVSNVQKGEIPGQKESPYHSSEYRAPYNASQEQVAAGRERQKQSESLSKTKAKNVDVHGEQVSVKKGKESMRNPRKANKVARINPDYKNDAKTKTSKRPTERGKRNDATKINKKNNSNATQNHKRGAHASSTQSNKNNKSPITQWEAQQQVNKQKPSYEKEQKGRNPYQDINEQNIRSMKEKTYSKNQDTKTNDSKYSLKREGLLNKTSLLHGKKED